MEVSMDLKDQVEFQGGKIEVLSENEWVDLREMRVPKMGINGYVYAHEAHGHGHGVAILPFRRNPTTAEISCLLRVEVVPCWGLDPTNCAITGSWDHEGEDFAQTAVRELKEEAGYEVTVDKLIPLGTCRGTKALDTLYYLYGVDVTDMEQGIATGDGSELEDKATTDWRLHSLLGLCDDPLVSTMAMRLSLKLLEGD